MDNSSEQSNEGILIRKASGEEESFSSEKLKQSLKNAGAKEVTILKIVSDIEAWIYPGVTTKKIYTRAFTLLRGEKTSSSIRYKLKQAILELGPTGYPFESLIGRLFEKQGFSTEVGIVVDGKCVTHEMDVIATQDGSQHLVECKYHADQGRQVSIQVPLYVRARVDDIISTRQGLPEYQGFSFKGWVVTNTRFSSDSINFSKCSGLKLLGWDYPNGNGLKEMIERLHIYPITVLHSLLKKEKRYLLEQKIVTCSQLQENIDALQYFNFSTKKYRKVIEELNAICK
jgi:Restriction endonuclease